MICEYRKLTNSELKELKDYVSISTKILRFVFVTVVIVILTFLFSRIMHYFDVKQPIWIIFLLGLYLWYFIKQDKLTGGAKFFASVKRDIEDGRCKLVTITPKQILKIEEVEDEGSTYIIEDIDGIYIFLSGQSLYPLEEDGFPWKSFVATESINAGVEFGINKSDNESAKIDKILPPDSISLKTKKEIGALSKTAIFLTKEQNVGGVIFFPTSL